MPSLVIKSIPKSILDQLKARAKAHRRSMTQEAIVTLEKAMNAEAPVKFPKTYKPVKPVLPEDVARIIRRGRDLNP